ncbi:MAG: TRAP transporter permease [Gammaproteobacteria bacterium]|nr:TRAP transporter permease [Gammaproteobacteria bacterium]MDA7990172.1 TRAP transporter permease [Gammaproteobacteria bacterium]
MTQPSTNTTSGNTSPDTASAKELVAATDTGARDPRGAVGAFLAWSAFAWSAFQIWIASPLPYMAADFIPVPNNTDTRSIHLAFGLLLAYLAYPMRKSSPRDRIPAQDWALAALGVCAAMYLSVFAESIAERPGLPTFADLAVATAGLILVLEGARRALGMPLAIIAGIFLLYVFFGHMAPEVIAWKGASYGKAMSHMWITQEGVFGVALGVSTSMVFLFVLFGSLLERAGAGNYFIWVAFSLLGHMRGGPAKAAVVSSAMTGLVSGSSIANVVTTGTFTIPLMKRVGFPAEKAGAVEVASSTNGQLTPPVMGAAAFLMIEFVGISYIEVIKHAFLPAIIAYIALVYIVHLEACKAGLRGLPRAVARTRMRSLLVFTVNLLGIVILSGICYYFFSGLKNFAGAYTFWASAAVILAVYVGLVAYATKFPELGHSDQIDQLPVPGPVVKSGLYYLLPVVALIWCLTVERLSPGLSAFYASLLMFVILLTHKPLKALLRKQRDVRAQISEGMRDLKEGMVAGARNMIGISVATACAGIILGTVTLTGIGLVMAEFVEFISAGNLMLMLLFTAVISLILGMGLPTTANYIVVSSLMAPVIVSVGAAHGLIVPLIAVHLFVFYFGILADDTPPVGLAAYAAAAVSGGDPIRTGIQGFAYDIRTAILPFLFIFNTELLMVGIENWFHLLLVVASATTAMLLFAAATQGWLVTRALWWERAALLLIAFTLFRPGFWMDMAHPPLEKIDASKIYEVVEAMPGNTQVRVHVIGETLEGDAVDKVVMLPLGPRVGSGAERLSESAGLELRVEDGKYLVDNIAFGGPAERQKIDFDWEVADIQRKADRPAKQWMFLPALALLAVVVWAQRRRLAVARG